MSNEPEFVLVPREPDDAMIAAGRAHAAPATQNVGSIYRAMLAARPAAPSPDPKAFYNGELTCRQEEIRAAAREAEQERDVDADPQSDG